ncbi:MAG: hypothetical protein PHR52_12885 [Fermentimonas sp.]|nr:hypothetical protein [Fermentimonas sp.]
MRKFKIYVPGRTTEAFIDAKEVKLVTTTGHAIFYNESGAICASAPAEAVIVEVQ